MIAIAFGIGFMIGAVAGAVGIILYAVFIAPADPKSDEAANLATQLHAANSKAEQLQQAIDVAMGVLSAGKS